MALLQPGLIFRAEGVSTLQITARAQESFRIKRIFITNVSAALAFATLVNDTARVGFFRLAGMGGAHLGGPNDSRRGTNLLSWMTKWLGFPGYPVAAGESFFVNINTGTADIFVLADSMDVADNKRDMPNGAASADVTFVNYGTNSLVIAATGYNKLDTTFNPPEMSPFPFGVVARGLVPAGKRQTVLMVGGQATGRFVAAGATAQTQFLRPRVGAAPAMTLFDRADVGLPFFGFIPAAAGVDYTSSRQALWSAMGNGSPNVEVPLDDVIVLPQLTFNPNDELQIQIQSTIVGAGQFNVNDIDVWVITRIFPAT